MRQVQHAFRLETLAWCPRSLGFLMDAWGFRFSCAICSELCGIPQDLTGVFGLHASMVRESGCRVSGCCFSGLTFDICSRPTAQATSTQSYQHNLVGRYYLVSVCPCLGSHPAWAWSMVVLRRGKLHPSLSRRDNTHNCSLVKCHMSLWDKAQTPERPKP